MQPTTLIISLNDVKATEVAASDWTGKQIRFPIKSDSFNSWAMVEPTVSWRQPDEQEKLVRRNQSRAKRGFGGA